MSHLYNISSVTEHWRKTHMHMASRTTKRRETQGQAGVHAGQPKGAFTNFVYKAR